MMIQEYIRIVSYELLRIFHRIDRCKFVDKRELSNMAMLMLDLTNSKYAFSCAYFTTILVHFLHFYE